jgi:hypothetical protein
MSAAGAAGGEGGPQVSLRVLWKKAGQGRSCGGNGYPQLRRQRGPVRWSVLACGRFSVAAGHGAGWGMSPWWVQRIV